MMHRQKLFEIGQLSVKCECRQVLEDGPWKGPKAADGSFCVWRTVREMMGVMRLEINLLGPFGILIT